MEIGIYHCFYMQQNIISIFSIPMLKYKDIILQPVVHLGKKIVNLMF